MAQIIGPKVDLFFKCKDLADLDVRSKSDPQIWLYSCEGGALKNDILVGKTEIIKDNLNPVFATSIRVDYMFEKNQEFKFIVVDVDETHGALNDQEIIGEIKCTLGEIIGSAGMSRELRLERKNKRSMTGMLFVSSEVVVDSIQIVNVEFQASGLDNKDGLFGKSDPFLRIYRQRVNGKFDAVYKTDYLKNTCNPVWPQFSVSLQALANGDINRTLRIDCLDYDADGSEDFIGSCTTSIAGLQSGRAMHLINEKKQQKKKKYKHSGVLECHKCDIRTQPGFLDYLRGGLQMNLMIGVDFTASNGDVKYPQSLHYNNPQAPNEYVRAIQSVGQILSNYDHDQNFPVFGFGGYLSATNETSHCFPLNGSNINPAAHGVGGVLGAYSHALQNVQLSGPTYFNKVIKRATKDSKGCSQGNQTYTVLMILTDGEICDLQQTVDAIVEASAKAISIVIVGVGSADFSSMDKLDADVTPLIDTKGKTMIRDTVQFVPFRQFTNMNDIAEATLREIPDQVVSYMQSKNITPGKCVYAPVNTQSCVVPQITGGAYPPQPAASLQF
ncbi:hypothetical protein SARC_05668 [Sphaeroforma arctica JP610]|uniref:C2 domain-containing protein n=1 Tax=Sphaeroforma arctica JP610 TaxID=667725 RepID=A0A0L0FZN6_9EUKA|nr:hypothetical protein SARC_05668 [Sphaeroforma arctica JP610]KNC82031.1 hypothetical protein SARC_05668 [Sphaeroforma arctica JP610]|eukprot:XP_014155933.1 hypothetical protein SARC_05668 [Sphaeroforma arctica JP610]